jgi:23S rRNA pseudouridine2605 synthase
VTDPAHAVDDRDLVTVDGERISAAGQRVVYAVNKPAGVVCTARDPQGRPTVVSLVDSPLRLYPVGRLDIDTTGLILLTNDGDLAHQLTHPSFEIEKTYRASVARAPIRDRELRALRSGVELDDGPSAPARARRVSADTVELTIHEGRKRQVRRMLEAVGHPVRRLERVRFGSLALGALEEGASRRLAPREVESLRRLAAGTAGPSGSGSRSRARPPAR